MSNVALAETPILQFLNNSGQLNAGGSLLTQVGGVNYPTYQDSAGATALPNPIPLNSRGEISNSSGVSCQLYLLPGVVYTFTLFDVNGNQLWTAGNVTALAPVAVGSMTDEKGSGGQPGFVAGVDFTAGTSTTLTLSNNYGSASNLWVAFDADEQGADTFSLGGTNNETLTFNAPIPVGVNKVYVKGGTALTIGTPSPGTVGPAQFAFPVSGPTASRPTAPLYVGQPYFDTTIGQTINAKNLTAPISWVTGDGTPPLSSIPNILHFGGVADGVTDNTAALAAAINAAPSGFPGVYFPPGKFAFTSLQTITLPAASSFMFLGAGQDQTELTFPNSSCGFVFNVPDLNSSVHIRDVSVLTQTKGNGNGIEISFTGTNSNPALSALSDIQNVTIRGSDGYGILNGNYWTIGLELAGISNINVFNVSVTGAMSGSGYATTGIGVQIGGNGASQHAVVFNFICCNFNFTQVGAQFNAYIEGMTFEQCNFVGGQYGIYVPATGASNPFTQLTVIGCSFGQASVNIYQITAVPNSMIAGNFFAMGGGVTGIGLNQVWLVTIVGNTFEGAPALSAVGINIGGNAPSGAASLITGNLFDGCGTAIVLGASSSGNNVQSNLYHACTTNVSNLGSGNTVGGGSQ